MYVVGLMSGTSGDGVDAALVDITGRGRSLKARTLTAHTLAYPRSLQQRILSASVSGTVADVCHLNALLGEWFANAALHVIRQAKLQPGDVALIGSHGETVHHLPHGIHAPGVAAIRSTLATPTHATHARLILCVRQAKSQHSRADLMPVRLRALRVPRRQSSLLYRFSLMR